MKNKVDCDRCENGRIIDKSFNLERAEELLKKYNKELHPHIIGNEAQRYAFAQTVKLFMVKGEIPYEELDIDNSYTCPLAHVCKNVVKVNLIGENNV